MNYHNITHDDMLNGDGLRVVLWLAGCEHCCHGCQNPLTWDVNGGITYDHQAFREIMDGLAKNYISGFTFSGGDPLHTKNREEVEWLAEAIKGAYPDKTIWMYTGYMWEDVKDLPVMKYVDVLVDGPYIASQRSPNLPWVGSSNQRVIDVRASESLGKVVLHA